MNIHRLYQLIKMWEVALTLTKPDTIRNIRIEPVINSIVECYGEGKIHGSIVFTLEKEEAHAEDSLVDIYKEYNTIEESKEAQKEMVLCLIDYLEQYLEGDNITLIWNQIDELDLNWH